MEKCANCERTIGKLETPYLWKEDTVCVDCYESLTRAKVGSSSGAAPPSSYFPADPPRPAAASPRRHPGHGEVICTNPNCGWIGKPTKKSRGSAIVMIFLFCFGVLPGLIYAMAMSGYDYFCPVCGVKLRTEHR